MSSYAWRETCGMGWRTGERGGVEVTSLFAFVEECEQLSICKHTLNLHISSSQFMGDFDTTDFLSDRNKDVGAEDERNITDL